MLKSILRITLLLILTIGIAIASFLFGANRGYKIGVLESSQYIRINTSLVELEKQASSMFMYKQLSKKEYEKSIDDNLKFHLEMYNLSKSIKYSNNRKFFDEVILSKELAPLLSVTLYPKTLRENIATYLKTYYTKEEIEKNKEIKKFLEENLK